MNKSAKGFLIDQAGMKLLSRFYASQVTIEHSTITQDTYGAEVKAWSATSMINVPCSIGPNGAQEQKSSDGTYSVGNFTIAMRGYYPNITTENRARIDHQVYDILAVESDSHKNMTHLMVRVVN